MPILPYLLTATLYAALALLFWHRHWAQTSSTLQPARSVLREHVLIALPLALHGYLLYGSMFGADGLRLGVGNALSAILWLTVLIYWSSGFVQRLEGLQILVLPAAAVAVLMPALLPAAKALPNTEFLALRAHLVIALLAYSLFTIASLHVLLMAVIERRLHTGTLPAPLQGMPPLLTMETLLFRIILAGFVLLTLTLGTGIVFSEELFGKAARFNHKTVFGVLSWLIFAALLAGRYGYGWRGRVAMRWTLAGFLMLVLAYIGSRFVVEVILGRG